MVSSLTVVHHRANTLVMQAEGTDQAVGQAWSRREKCSVASFDAPIDQAKHEREQAELRDEIRGFHYDEAARVWHILFRDQSQPNASGKTITT